MIKINLLPQKPKKDALKLDLYLFLIVLFVTLLVFGGIYLKNAKDISTYKGMVQQVKQEISSLEGIYKEYLAMEKEKKEIKRRIAAIDQIKTGRGLAARILYDLSNLTKENVWITNFRKNENMFQLEGRSLENESISELIENLSKIPYIKDIELKNVQEVPEGMLRVKSFLITGKISL